jgi:hypothetical protein
MMIQLSKYGHLLTSRELGRESWQAFWATLQSRDLQEPIIVDFSGVTTFSPSWGDEFFTPLLHKVRGPIILRNTENPSVTATMQLLREIHGDRFSVES